MKRNWSAIWLALITVAVLATTASTRSQSIPFDDTADISVIPDEMQQRPQNPADMYAALTREKAECYSRLGRVLEYEAQVADGTLVRSEDFRKALVAQVIKEFTESNPELAIDPQKKWKVEKKTAQTVAKEVVKGKQQ
jgi:hypothetical protein